MAGYSTNKHLLVELDDVSLENVDRLVALTPMIFGNVQCVHSSPPRVKGREIRYHEHLVFSRKCDWSDIRKHLKWLYQHSWIEQGYYLFCETGTMTLRLSPKTHDSVGYPVVWKFFDRECNGDYGLIEGYLMYLNIAKQAYLEEREC